MSGAISDELLHRVRNLMSSVQIPQQNDKVYKDECMFSFDTPFSPGGLYVNLSTFQGYGEEYVHLDHQRTSSALYLHIKSKKIPILESEKTADDNKPDKLAIGVEGGFQVGAQKFNVEEEYSLVVMPDAKRIPYPNKELPEIIIQAIEALKAHTAANYDQDVTAWEDTQDIKPTKYAEHLIQLEPDRKIPADPSQWKCDFTGVTSNLWLNLSTGKIGSGRQNYDGTGGNASALKHYHETGGIYPLAVKLGTITPIGADVYSYAPDEDDMVLNPYLAKHLAHWGINMMNMEKSEKTMAELQVDLNLQHEWKALTEQGETLEPLSGPGYTGLDNLGNSCYMNSVMQTMFAIPEFAQKFLPHADTIRRTAPRTVQSDVLSQITKLGEALVLGKIGCSASSTGLKTEQAGSCGGASSSSAEVRQNDAVCDEQNSVKPSRFKQLIGKGHVEFSSARQQDAQEYVEWLLTVLTRVERQAWDRLPDVSVGHTEQLFKATIECREEHGDGRVKYSYQTQTSVLMHVPPAEVAAINMEQVQQDKERRSKRQKTGDDDTDKPVLPIIPFDSVMSKWLAPETLQSSSEGATKQRTLRINSFPPYLLIALGRYEQCEDWTVRKVEASVPMPDELDLSIAKARGPQPNEEIIPNDQSNQNTSGADHTPTTEQPTAPVNVDPDPTILSQLMSMGFSEQGCRKACVAMQNAGVEACMEWVLNHMDDADFNTPMETSAEQNQADGAGASSAAVDVDGGAMDVSSVGQAAEGSRVGPSASVAGAAGGVVDDEVLRTLMGMGFGEGQATAALKACDGKLEAAANLLISGQGEGLSEDLIGQKDGEDDAGSTEAVVGVVNVVRNTEGGSEVQLPGKSGAAPEHGIDQSPPDSATPCKYKLTAFISHMGSNTTCGHYVCHVFKEGRWVLYNDEKVAVSAKPPKDLGYLYLYRRED